VPFIFCVPTARVAATTPESPNFVCFLRSEAQPAAGFAKLRRMVAKTNPAYRVSNVQTQQELIDNQTIRERLLASAQIKPLISAARQGRDLCTPQRYPSLICNAQRKILGGSVRTG
jgi:hypothetical protein